MTIPGAFALSALVFLFTSGMLGLAADSKHAIRQGQDSAFRKGAWLSFAVSVVLVLIGIWGAVL